MLFKRNYTEPGKYCYKFVSSCRDSTKINIIRGGEKGISLSLNDRGILFVALAYISILVQVFGV